MERERIPRELPKQVREMMENPSPECYPYARKANVNLLLKDVIGERKKRFFCTACGESFVVEQRQTVSDELAADLYYAKHNEKEECMMCGSEGVVIEGKRWNLSRHAWYAPMTLRVQLEGAWQALLCFEVRRRLFYDEKNGYCQDLALAKEDVYLIGRGAAGHYQYQYYYQDFVLHKKIDADGCNIRGGFGSAFARHTSSTGNVSFDVHDIGYWEKSRDILKYMPEEMKAAWDPCVAAATFAVYPATEMLWKAGYHDIVRTFMRAGKKCAAICQLDGGSMREVFPKFTKVELNMLREKNLCRVGAMEHYVKLKKIYGTRVSPAMEALSVLEAGYWLKDKVLDTAKAAGVEPHVLFRYIDKIVAENKKKKKPKPWTTGRSSVFDHWHDYVEAAIAVGLDLTREDVVLPKDLGKRHDMAVKLHRDILAQQAAKDMEEVFRKNEERYGFSDGEFVIVNPRSSYDIIDEGKAQCHCVAGYADRHAKGTLAIVFIRRVGEEDKALITVEMREDHLQQARKKHNSAPNAHEYAFINKWLDEVAERFHPSQKKRKEKTAVAVGV